MMTDCFPALPPPPVAFGAFSVSPLRPSGDIFDNILGNAPRIVTDPTSLVRDGARVVADEVSRVIREVLSGARSAIHDAARALIHDAIDRMASHAPAIRAEVQVLARSSIHDAGAYLERSVPGLRESVAGMLRESVVAGTDRAADRAESAAARVVPWVVGGVVALSAIAGGVYWLTHKPEARALREDRYY
ncbi:MAG: hypothetical protein JNK72_24675 [Myxococcales bacterium]|nr:hypothetical protein [Myxococcales bacterium]